MIEAKAQPEAQGPPGGQPDLTRTVLTRSEGRSCASDERVHVRKVVRSGSAYCTVTRAALQDVLLFSFDSRTVPDESENAQT
jgi:hypothetical protein